MDNSILHKSLIKRMSDIEIDQQAEEIEGLNALVETLTEENAKCKSQIEQLQKENQELSAKF